MIIPLHHSTRRLLRAVRRATSLAVLIPAAAFAAPPVISVPSPDLHYYHVPEDPNTAQFGYAIVASNSPTSYNATGLPPNAVINRTTGTISGGLNVPGVFPLTLSATNSDGTGTAQVRLMIHPAFVGVTTSRGDFTTGQSFTITLTCNRALFITGRPAVAFSTAAGTRSAGYVSGSGTPTLVFSFTVGADDNTDGREIQLLNVDTSGGTLRDADGLDPSPRLPLRFFSSGITFGSRPAITSSTSASVVRGNSFNYQITASNTPTSFSVGPLPPGFTPTANGFSGTPTTAGTYTIPLSATNRYGAGTATLTLIVTDPATPITVTNASANATAGQAFTLTLATTGNPTTFNAVGLPAGLAINNAGVISGTPSATGTFIVSVTASNATGGSGSGTVTLNVAAAPPSIPPIPPVVTPPPVEPPPPPPPVIPPVTPPTTPPVTPPPTPPPVTPPPTTPPVVPPTTPPVTPPPPVVPVTPTPQTIAFAPIGSLVVGTPLPMSATASSGLPVGFSIVSGNATLVGNQLTVNDTGAVTIRATQSGNDSFASAVAEITVAAGRAAQSIDFSSPVSSIIIGQPVPLGATATSGLPITYSVVSGPATIDGSTLTVTGPGPVVIRATQAGSPTVNPSSADITLSSASRAAQGITFTPAVTELLSDRVLPLEATATSGLPVAFEVVSGPAIIRDNALVPTSAAGVVTIRALQAGNDRFDAAQSTREIRVLTASRLINLSARVQVREGDASRSFIAGFVVSGDAPKRMLVRAVGPALAGFGVQAPLMNPRLRVTDQAGRVLGSNDDWSGSETAAAFARLGAFGLPAGARDAAMIVTLAPGAYSLHVEANGGEGIALAEIYDAGDVPALETQQLINLSTRAHVDTGEGVLATGFVVTGSVPKRVLIRGVGPALTGFGVPGALADPVLNVYSGDTVIARNDDWQTAAPVTPSGTAATADELATAFGRAGAFPLGAGAKDAALIIELPPGAYTAIVSGANNTTGAGLVEVYELTRSP